MLLKRKRWAWCCKVTLLLFSLLQKECHWHFSLFFQTDNCLRRGKMVSYFFFSKWSLEYLHEYFCFEWVFVHMSSFDLQCFFCIWVWSNHNIFTLWLKCIKYSLRQFFWLRCSSENTQIISSVPFSKIVTTLSYSDWDKFLKCLFLY